MTIKINDAMPMSSVKVRSRLEEALKLDLVGPSNEHEFAEERLPGRVRPSNWYLTGFLIPSGTAPEKNSDADENDDLDEVPGSAGLAEESNDERKAAKKGRFPSSMGISFLMPKEARSLEADVQWGDYEKAEIEDRDGKRIPVWQRRPREKKISLSLKGHEGPAIYDIADSNGLQIEVLDRRISADDLEGHLPQGVRSVSVFLVNNRAPIKEEPDLAYAFQTEIAVTGDHFFVPRPDLRGARTTDWDELVADLHYANTPEFAAGHGVSAEWEVAEGVCGQLRTSWIPSAEVERTETVDVPGVELSMDALGALQGGASVVAALQPLVDRYRVWIAARKANLEKLAGSKRKTAGELLRLTEIAAKRIEQGIEFLTQDIDALDAFRAANRAVARALRQRLKDLFKEKPPHWWAFQLAFFLMNLPGITDPKDPHRQTVDLLFFPTGGGKTEAYLGLAAYTMVLRRLRNPSDRGLAGAGVSVVMRYTLRLLTLDQLGRAAGLICALELERRKDPARYGEWPFEIGLWVGKAATPNVLGYKNDGNPDSARTKVRQFKADPKSKPSPIPLENCPWCGKKFEPESFNLLPDDDKPQELRIVCSNPECEFIGDKSLPIIAVDEPIYRRLPAFLIATVDKFAGLPWVGQAGALFGGADRYDEGKGFYGAAEPGRGKRLSVPFPPPDLVVQDELHLISGPLGTMAGLYEAAIEALCIREIDGRSVGPKIIASTATVRRAQDQVQALFGRPLTQVFPPPGPDRKDSFFARMVPTSETPGRLYLGVASQGRNPKVVMRKVWLALMGAAERAYRDAGGHGNPHNPADPYMTVIGYFNSLRELGGARRILEEEVQNTVKAYGARKRIGEVPGLFQDRKTFSEVVELTSRVPTDKVAEARRRLGCAFHEAQRVDCAIATNMISVGLDIPRLGLMGVLGQPKTSSEYIQATSRVGRTIDRPGLVVTLLNIHKPRDRSHYERFRHYHETFYRSVEVASLTPFSARALDRGFAGALVGLARHAFAEMSPSKGVEHIVDSRDKLERLLLAVFRSRVNQQPGMEADERAARLLSVQSRIVDLLDSWRKIFEDYQAKGIALQYQKYELAQPKPLLREVLDKEFESEHHKKFKANRSLRDVEPEVNLFLGDLRGARSEGQP